MALLPKNIYFNQFKEELNWVEIFYYSGITNIPMDTSPAYFLSVGYKDSHHSWLDMDWAILDTIVEGSPSHFQCRPIFPTSLPDGNYSCTISLEVGFVWQTGEFQTEDSGYISVYLEVKAGIMNFSFSPNSATIKVNKANRTIQSQQIDVLTPNSIDFVGDPIFNLDGTPLPYQINESGQFTLKANNSTLDFPPGSTDYELKFKRNNDIIGVMPIKLLVTNNDNFDVFPLKLNFESTQGLAEAPSQNIHIYSSVNDIEITFPQWLKADFVSMKDGFTVYQITPKQNAPVGHNKGAIIVSGVMGEAIIEVNFILNGVWNENFNKDYHFSQSGDLLQITKTSPNSSFIRLKLDIKVYDFGGKVNEFVRVEDIPFFEKLAKKDIGLIIHRLLNYYEKEDNVRFSILTRSNSESKQYKFAEVFINAQELEFDTLNQANSFSLPLQKYMRGVEPKSHLKLNSSIYIFNQLLSNRSNTITKISPKGFISYNFLRNNSETLEILVNNLPVTWTNKAISHIDPTPDVYIFGGLISIKDIKAIKPNDLIELKYSGQKLSYFISQISLNSVNLFYKNVWGLIDVIEFTGEFDLEGQYARITNNEFNGWVENTRTLSTTNKQRLKINSGFMLQENASIINELMLSEQVWFYLGEEKIQGRIVSEKVTTRKTSENLLDFELEFEITNKQYGNFYK